MLKKSISIKIIPDGDILMLLSRGVKCAWKIGGRRDVVEGVILEKHKLCFIELHVGAAC